MALFLGTECFADTDGNKMKKLKEGKVYVVASPCVVFRMHRDAKEYASASSSEDIAEFNKLVSNRRTYIDEETGRRITVSNRLSWSTGNGGGPGWSRERIARDPLKKRQAFKCPPGVRCLVTRQLEQVASVRFAEIDSNVYVAVDNLVSIGEWKKILERFREEQAKTEGKKD